MLRFLAFVLCAVLYTNLANADAMSDKWQKQLAGLDGVTITCANANKEKYAAKICKNMLKEIASIFESANIPITSLGSYFIKSEQAPSKPDTMTNPLNITVFVRATHSGNTLAINLITRISVTYRNAVEFGKNGTGRSGELVLWEGSTTGAGPRKGLPPAITKGAIGKFTKQIIPIVTAWPNRK